MRDYTTCWLRKTGDCDGRLVRDTERALQFPKGQGQDEADGDPVDLLRHPHGKRGEQDRVEGAFGGCFAQIENIKRQSLFKAYNPQLRTINNS